MMCHMIYKAFYNRLFVLRYIYSKQPPFSGANIGVCCLRAHALGAERDIEVKMSNKTFEQNGAKITVHIYNDSCLQMIEMGWWSKFESAHRLMEGVDV